MKITYLLNTADALGGTERAIFTQADYLARRHQVEVISVFRTSETSFFANDARVRRRYLVDLTGPTPRPLRPSSVDDAAYEALARSDSRLIPKRWERQFNRLADLEVEQALRSLDADVLVSSSPALMSLATRLAPPGVVTVHQEHRPSQLRGGTGQPLFQMSPRLDALVVLTDRTKDWFVDTFGTSAPRLEVIPNSIPDGFRPQSDLRNPVVAIAGRMVPEKRIDHAIRAFGKVAAAHPQWTLRVYGDGPLLPEMRRLAADLGLHDNVQLVGATDRMTEEWAKASLALLSSRDGEALPLVLLEAFAAGVPAVSYDIQTGPAEIITHGVDGLLVPSGDEDHLAQALIRLIADNEMRLNFGANALVAAERYRIEPIMQRWEELFTELIADHSQQEQTRADRLASWLALAGGSGFAPAAPRPGHVTVGPDLESLERQIEDAVPGLIRSGGRLSVVRDDLTPADVSYDNFSAVVDVLTEHGIQYWVARDAGVRHRVVVPLEQREATLAALARRFARAPYYAETLAVGAKVTSVALAACLVSEPRAADAAGLRVFKPIVSPSRTLRYGPAVGCDVEFWVPSAQGDSLLATRRTLLGDSVPTEAIVPATVTIRDRQHPTIEPFTQRLVSDVDFPIDVVYTWVDGADPAWLASKNSLLSEAGRSPVDAAESMARFRDRAELRYSLRSIDMYAPWVRNIYLVTAGQNPNWLDTGHSRIKVIDHRDLFGSRGMLPTFNSHAIESQLHHIDGLAEHFIYFNDDFFLGRPVQPNLFFRSNGLAQFFLSPTPIPMVDVSEEDDFNFSAAKNNRRLIREAFDRVLTHGLLHAPYPMRRSVAYDLDKAFSEEVERTAASRLRNHADVSIASSLHHYYGYLTQRSVQGAIRVSYVNTGDPSEHPQLTQILITRGYDAFCLNDTHHGDLDETEQVRVVSGFLESYFPVASQFERGSARNQAIRARL
ncbi:stealth conserved region 3 domain-containing protein [Micromonospora andamanensis]|uniref:Exopolysaccharide phosphotransferase n=1 Tax=Micromonospora andamanensis TaxID=1287068 RepID=A0ABQ4I0X8_9ACTN|nr:stealth conserved region 3 domain-containing protein [Micromonospora andamanensis]GIJ11568.1 exopolysaccharide phosphotransferase [Micromonospora andamanensis]GIJ39886.1 exopolysaccharide phosphotransferase [Micromonospora andamanensis]